MTEFGAADKVRCWSARVSLAFSACTQVTPSYVTYVRGIMPETEEHPMAEPHTTTQDAQDEAATPPDSTSTQAPDRRTMLKGLALAGAALPILAACGSSSSDAASPGGGASPKPGGGASSEPGSGEPSRNDSSPTDPGSSDDVLAKASDVEVGGGVILPNRSIVITQPTKGTFEGFSSTCTHMGCTVSTISNGTIICPCHGSQYSIKDGSVVAGPAPLPLPKKPVKDEGGNIVPA
jgi:nitrite reductase/ring-hydroxylating ferredoxin subunit